MTTNALVDDTGMIKSYRIPGNPRVMAHVAFKTRRNMGRAFSLGADVVMATAAQPQHFGMIHCDRGHERHGVMTRIAIVGGSNMGGGLADGTHAIVTTGAGAQNLTMIHLRRNPRGRDMTGVANGRGRNVCWIFTRRQHAVMAIYTGSGNRSMVKRATREHRPASCAVRVADVTRCRGNDVRGRFAFGANAVMATAAINRNAR